MYEIYVMESKTSKHKASEPKSQVLRRVPAGVVSKRIKRNRKSKTREVKAFQTQGLRRPHIPTAQDLGKLLK